MDPSMEREFMLSSFLLLAPAFVAFYRARPVLGVVSVAAFAASFNFWTYPGHTSLLIDKLTALSALIIYSAVGIANIKGFFTSVIAWSLFFMTAILYHVSVAFHKRRHKMWMLVHALFHFVVGCSMVFVIIL